MNGGANIYGTVFVTDVEDAELGTNHAVVGYFLARRWHLADFIAEAVLHHHDYSVLARADGISETARTLIALVVLAIMSWPLAVSMAFTAFLKVSLPSIRK